LCYSFEERLAAQRKEKEEIAAAEELGFKKPLSKEEKQEKKKQRLAAIGEDLLAIAADQPFRFPATFTFVVRAFSGLQCHSNLYFLCSKLKKYTNGYFLLQYWMASAKVLTPDLI